VRGTFRRFQVTARILIYDLITSRLGILHDDVSRRARVAY